MKLVVTRSTVGGDDPTIDIKDSAGLKSGKY